MTDNIDGSIIRNRINDNCISYEEQLYELLLPSPIIFNTLCLSYDKTYLFIVSLIRLIFYVILYYFFDELIDYKKYPYVKYTFITLIIINMVYLGFVVSKRTLFSPSNNMSLHSKTNGRPINSVLSD